MYKRYDTWVFVMPDGQYFSANTDIIEVGTKAIFRLTVEDDEGRCLVREIDVGSALAFELKKSMEEIYRLQKSGEWGAQRVELKPE